MPAVINTNISSLNTQRNVSASSASLATSIQRLSTGLRVNSAKDDAAGLAIAERMNAQVRGLNVAARNANDGVSLAQTAEGALGKVGEMVQRIRELAVQSSNATNSADDRKALQAEVKQLTEEIDRVSKTTNFNGTKLLDGKFTDQKFQVGADAGQSISIAKISSSQIADLGSVTETSYSATSGAVAVTDATKAAIADAFTITVGGTDYDISLDAATGSTDAELTTSRKNDIVAKINAQTANTGVTAALDTDGNVALSSDAAFTLTATGTTVGTAGFAAGSVTVDETETTEAMDKLNIEDYDGAQKAIKMADAALKQINESRADLGAIQSRFENAITNIQMASENTMAARSRIMDTDFAAETASMTRSQILQQAGNAMLSQANQLPQQVLSLLR